MKRLMAITLLGACAAFALPAAATENAQQERMKTCNAKAEGKKGDERKAFMSDCLSNEKKASENRMSTCNTKSKGLKGEEHKKFMSECMKATS